MGSALRAGVPLPAAVLVITCCAAAALAALQGPPAGAQAPVTLVQVYVRGMLKCHASVHAALRCHHASVHVSNDDIGRFDIYKALFICFI